MRMGKFLFYAVYDVPYFVRLPRALGIKSQSNVQSISPRPEGGLPVVLDNWFGENLLLSMSGWS